MKFILSRKELTKLVCDKFNLPEDTQVVVSRNEPKVKEAKTVTLLRKFIHEATTQFPGPSNKISAIKRLRELGAGSLLNIGLADAKFAIENPEQAIKNMAERGIIYSQPSSGRYSD